MTLRVLQFTLSLLCFVTMTVGPPVPVCLVKQSLYKMSKQTDCGDGTLVKLADLVNPDPALGLQDVEKFGADNVADLILSRSSGIFDYQRHNLENLFICAKHLNEIGKNWKAAERTRFHGRHVSKCSITYLEGFPAPHTTVVEGPRSLTKQESQTIFRYNHTLVPLGTGKSY